MRCTNTITNTTCLIRVKHLPIMGKLYMESVIVLTDLMKFQGVILEQVNSGTNHHSIVEYQGQWYLFYHNSDLYFENNPAVAPRLNWGGVNPFRRSICVDYLYYNEDGTIQQVSPTKKGVKKIK